MPYRKNVFVIGAGVSAHRGAPLMGSFLEVARAVRDRGSLAPDERQRFDNVIGYWTKHDLTEKAAGLNLSNLEDLFGLVDLNMRIDPQVASVRKDMVFMILRTLESKITPEIAASCAVLYRPEPTSQTWGGRPVSVMRQFVDMVSRRWDENAVYGNVEHDSIISTNYDVLVEEALVGGDIDVDYVLPKHPAPYAKATIKVLKLHGSANWSICAQCNRARVHPFHTEITTLETGPCDLCGWRRVEPFIVPPTWSKGEHRAALESIWKAAFQELVTARRWVFIGTSLPDTDRFLKFLFGLALQHNQELDRIVIIDPNKSGYDDLFQGRASRISLEHAEVYFGARHDSRCTVDAGKSAGPVSIFPVGPPLVAAPCGRSRLTDSRSHTRFGIDAGGRP